MKKFLAMTLAIVVICGCLAACGKATDKALVGEWHVDLDKMLEGEDQAVIDMMKEMGYDMVLEFKADGSGKMTITMGDEPDVTEFKYEVKNNQIVIDGEPADYTIKGNSLVVTFGGETMPFIKK